MFLKFSNRIIFARSSAARGYTDFHMHTKNLVCSTNADKDRVTACFDFGPAGGVITSARLLFEAGRRVVVNASVFTDEFDEIGVHVYELRTCNDAIPYE